MISEGEAADIIYSEMTDTLLTPPSAVRVQCVGACTQVRTRAGRQPLEADYFSECCHFGRKHLNKKGVSEFQERLIEHLTGD